MRARLHPDAAIVLLALFGVGGLALLAHLSAPPLVALGDAALHEGERVLVEGRALHVGHSPRARVLALTADGHRLTVLAPAGQGPERGDVVRALGIVTRLNDGIGLSAERLDVMEKAATRPLDPADLARAPADFEGARVLVRGDLREDGGGRGCGEDAPGRVCTLAGGGARVRISGVPPPEVKGPWLAAGTFHYRGSDASYVLKVDAWTPPN